MRAWFGACLTTVVAGFAGSCADEEPVVTPAAVEPSAAAPAAVEPSAAPPAAAEPSAAAPAPAINLATLAGGWLARLDDPTEQPDKLAFAVVDGGCELKPGPNATVWHPDNRAGGLYRLAVDMTQVLSNGMHPHGAGVLVGGTELEGAGQQYTYFLVRGDGQFLIKTRVGGETKVVVPWTAHEALVPENRDGGCKNRLAVEVDATETRFLANAVVVHRAAKGSVPTDGLFGFRLVHDLHVRFTTVELQVLPAK